MNLPVLVERFTLIGRTHAPGPSLDLRKVSSA
jgi:hypothetical protein